MVKKKKEERPDKTRALEHWSERQLSSFIAAGKWQFLPLAIPDLIGLLKRFSLIGITISITIYFQALYANIY